MTSKFLGKSYSQESGSQVCAEDTVSPQPLPPGTTQTNTPVCPTQPFPFAPIFTESHIFIELELRSSRKRHHLYSCKFQKYVI